jgi:hypothetical protein
MTLVYEFGGGRADRGRDEGSGDGGAEPVRRDADSAPVLLVTLYDPVEAEIVVAKLRSAGIDAFVKHEALSVVYGLTVDGAGQQDILVRPEDLEEAQAALEQTP